VAETSPNYYVANFRRKKTNKDRIRVGLTENDGRENDRPSKSQDIKSQDVKLARKQQTFQAAEYIE